MLYTDRNHSFPSTLVSYNTLLHLYLVHLTQTPNSEICSNCTLSTMTVPIYPSSTAANIALLLSTFTSRHHLQILQHSVLIITFRFSPDAPFDTRSPVYKRLPNLHTFPSSENLTPLISVFSTSSLHHLVILITYIINFTSSLTQHSYFSYAAQLSFSIL